MRKLLELVTSCIVILIIEYGQLPALPVHPLQAKARLLATKGQVEVRERGETNWRPIQENIRLHRYDRVRTFLQSRAAILLCSDDMAISQPNEGFVIEAPNDLHGWPCSGFWLVLRDTASKCNDRIADIGQEVMHGCLDENPLLSPRESVALDNKISLLWTAKRESGPFSAEICVKDKLVWSGTA